MYFGLLLETGAAVNFSFVCIDVIEIECFLRLRHQRVGIGLSQPQYQLNQVSS